MEYKGHEIDLNQKTEIFTLYISGDLYFSSASLMEVQGAIDKLIKKSKRIPAYILGGVSYSYGDQEVAYTEVEITSVSPDGDMWITDKKKNRARKRNGIFKKNAKNLELLKRIEKYRNEMAALDKTAELLKDKLEKVETLKKKEA